MFAGLRWTSGGFGFICLCSKDINSFSSSINRLFLSQQFPHSYHEYATHTLAQTHTMSTWKVQVCIGFICAFTCSYLLSLFQTDHAAVVLQILHLHFLERLFTQVNRCLHQSQGRFIRTDSRFWAISASRLDFNISYQSVVKLYIPGQFCFCFWLQTLSKILLKLFTTLEKW